MNKKNKFGFTLAELLIIVAIIAILVAVSIPMFSSKIYASKEAACAANCRGLKALLSSTYMDDNSEAEVEQKYNENKKDYTCPLGGTIMYKIIDGVLIVSCSHKDKNNSLSDKDKMKDLNDKLSALRKTNTYYNSGSSDADKKIIADALKEVGIDLNSFTTWSLRYDNGNYPKLYWSDVDVSKMNSGTTYMMAYTLSTGNYTVWKVNVNNGKVTGEVNGGLQIPEVENQTYKKALEKYNELMHK